jgi:hypothetical protein
MGRIQAKAARETSRTRPIDLLDLVDFHAAQNAVGDGRTIPGTPQ